jgi:hypothetical protein
MPPLPNEPGLYLWEQEGTIVYVGKATKRLRERLGSRNYATIGTYKTLARQRGRRNGGQQTNCRVNALANTALSAGHGLSIWYRVTESLEAAIEEARWMAVHGKPDWNLRMEHER